MTIYRSGFRLFIFRFALVCGLLLLGMHLAFSQTKIVKFSSLSLESGLSQSNVKFIAKDKTGFMWFATDDGLNRYDGYKFTVFKHDPKNKSSLPSNDVTCIYGDREGRMWVGSMGLSLYDPNSNSFNTITYNKNDDNSLTNAIVNCVFEDSKNNLWVGTYSGLNLYNVKTKKIKRFLYTKGRDDIARYQINSISED